MEKGAGHSFVAMYAVVFLLTLTTFAFGWGTDIPIWTGGNVNCFDVDYGLDGKMFIVFQAEGESAVRIYQSTDHGFTWNQFASLPTPANLARVRVIYDEPNSLLRIFHVDASKYLVSWRVSLTATLIPPPVKVSDAPIQEGSFDVTWNLKDTASGGRLYAYWSEGNDPGSNIFIKYASTSSATWTTGMASSWANGALTRASLAFGPPNRIYWSYATRSVLGGADSTVETVTRVFDESLVPTGIVERHTVNSLMDYDPRTAAANVDNSGVWVVYNRDEGGHEIDLFFKYSPDGGVTWNPAEYTVSSVVGVDEYIADIKPYKGPGNPFIDMVYIYDDPAGSPVRKVIWAFASTGDPTNWQQKTTVNDQDATSFPEDVAPRIIYSPGATASGGGVVFSYAGRSGLYFDAPWVQTLTVTVSGSGNVTSNPAGISCTNSSLSGPVTCKADFPNGTAVALTATPISGSTYTSSFYHWEGACSGTGGCAVSMTAAQAATADFVALDIPVYLLPVPSGTSAYPAYLPTESPVENPSKSLCKPFAVGNVSGGILDLNVGLHQYTGLIDVYLGISVPALSSDLWLITAANVPQKVSDGIAKWKAAVTGPISETLFGAIPVSSLPPATYNLYVLITPAGSLAAYDFYSTYFVIGP